MTTFLRALRDDCRGAALLEYSVLIGFIAGAVVVTLVGVGLVVGVVGLLGLLFFSSAAFAVVGSAMTVIFHHRAVTQHRHFLVSVLLPYGFVMLIGVGLFLLVERVTTGDTRGGALVVPLIVVAIGTGFLLEDTGAFEGEGVFVPLVAIAAGVGLILGARPSRR